MKNLLKRLGSNWLIMISVLFLIVFFIWKKIIRRNINVSYNRLNLSMSEDNVRILAESVYWTMANLGTKDKRLFALLEPLNKDDLKCLFVKFGYRQYDSIGGAFIIGGKKNLFEWFVSELSSKELQEMRNIWLKTDLFFPE